MALGNSITQFIKNPAHHIYNSPDHWAECHHPINGTWLIVNVVVSFERPLAYFDWIGWRKQYCMPFSWVSIACGGGVWFANNLRNCLHEFIVLITRGVTVDDYWINYHNTRAEDARVWKQSIIVIMKIFQEVQSTHTQTRCFPHRLYKLSTSRPLEKALGVAMQIPRRFQSQY